MLDRICLLTTAPGQFVVGIEVRCGHCGQCDVHHRDVYFNLGWISVAVFLGPRVEEI